MIRLSFFSLLISFCAQGLFGQNYTPKDAENVRKKHLMRQWSFEHNQSGFPAPKKDNWSIGIKGGHSFIAGDVRSTPGAGFGLNMRRAIGHIVSIRLAGEYTCNEGLNWRRQGGILFNDALNGDINPIVNYTTAAYPFVYHNFHSQIVNLSAEAVFNLNNLSFYDRSPKTLLYVFLGPSLLSYRTRINALDAAGAKYDYSTINPSDGSTSDDRINAIDRLNAILDDTYETDAETYPGKAKVGSFTLIPALTMGAGINFKISRRVDLAIEHRITPTFEDLVDGQRWQENNSLSTSTDFHQFTSLGLNFRIGKGKDSKWWTNPMEGPMERIRTLEAAAAKDNKDSDGDGIVDARDAEPHTPAGVKVDVRGVALDTDEDGVADFKDAEPFSPKGSQVDRSGKALDSDSDGIPDVFDQEINSRAGAQVDARGIEIKVPEAAKSSSLPSDLNLNMPMVYFDLGKAVVKAEFYPGLYNVARILKSDPSLKVKITGHADNRATNQYNSKLSRERADNVAAFLKANFGLGDSQIALEYFGADKPIVTGLPKNKDPRFEELHHLNRRVELEIVK